MLILRLPLYPQFLARRPRTQHPVPVVGVPGMYRTDEKREKWKLEMTRWLRQTGTKRRSVQAH